MQPTDRYDTLHIQIQVRQPTPAEVANEVATQVQIKNTTEQIAKAAAEGRTWISTYGLTDATRKYFSQPSQGFKVLASEIRW